MEFANHALSIPKGRSNFKDENYDNTGYGVSSPGIKNEKYICLKINPSNEKLLNFENWCTRYKIFPQKERKMNEIQQTVLIFLFSGGSTLQGQSTQTGFFELALRDRNIQV